MLHRQIGRFGSLSSAIVRAIMTATICTNFGFWTLRLSATGFRLPIVGLKPANCSPNYLCHVLVSQSKIQSRKSKIHRMTLSARARTLGGIAHHFGFSILDSRLFDHRITRSALAKIVGGMVKPICLAALRLMTSSNLFGRSTGKSPGFAPLRIL
jgi:hypothetical protein